MDALTKKGDFQALASGGHHLLVKTQQPLSSTTPLYWVRYDVKKLQNSPQTLTGNSQGTRRVLDDLGGRRLLAVGLFSLRWTTFLTELQLSTAELALTQLFSTVSQRARCFRGSRRRRLAGRP